jgi:hypothetical protein
MTNWLITLASFAGAAIGAALGWCLRSLWLARQKREEIQAWKRARKFSDKKN